MQVKEEHQNLLECENASELQSYGTCQVNIPQTDGAGTVLEGISQYIPGSLDQISSSYESLDYDPLLNSLWCDERRLKGYSFKIEKSIWRWVIVFWIGVLTAIIAFFIVVSIDVISGYKYTVLETQTNRCAAEGCLLFPYFLWVVMNVVPSLVAGILGSYIEPMSGGSGIPQVKCYLNGIKVPRIVRLKTLFCKSFGVIFSVLGGLTVGKEGPMIHSGAVVAAGISQGKTTTFNYDLGILKFMREDREKRDFVSAGAAAGVAAAFGAPVGGVLFSLEEGASFWNQALTWRVFFSALISTVSLNILLSAYKGDVGNLDNPGLLNLGKFDDLSYKYYEFVAFIVMGCFGGFLGAFFNHINYKLTVLRMKYLHTPLAKISETAVVSILTATVAFMMIYSIPDCRDIDSDKHQYHVRMFCDEGQENAAAILLFQTPEQCVRSLFHDRNGTYGWVTIGVFFVIYYLLACVTYGLGIPSGLFIPSLLAGAAMGRMCGMLLGTMFPNQPWVDEGKYALVGAAAMLGGVVRMTISLTVILMECVGNISFGLPLMIVVMISKWVGDFFNEGLYDIHIRLSGAPLVPWEPPPLTDNIFASEIMSRPVITLNMVESVRNIYEVLKRSTHNGFPVVEKNIIADDAAPNGGKEHGKLRGLVLRSQLIILLRNKVFNENTQVWVGDLVNMQLFRDSYPRFHTIDEVYLAEGDLEMTIDLRPFMNPSPYSVTAAAAYERIFRLFRALGLRHIVVINDEHLVVGIVTRKDLVRYRVLHHRDGVSLSQLDVYSN